MIPSFVRALISAFKARRELVPADELPRRHRGRSVEVLALFAVGDVYVSICKKICAFYLFIRAPRT